MDARRVDEYHLSVLNILDACDPVSCSLRLMAGYGNLFAYDLVQDRRLSHVWSANYAYKTGLEHLHFLYLVFVAYDDGISRLSQKYHE